jgi:glycosyltransferase involved in cell wall biosynthesis
VRILYLHQYFNTPEMPGGTRSYEMARRLVERGHQVELITSDRDGAWAGRTGYARTTHAGVVVHWLFVPYANQMGYAARMGAFAKFAWAAARWARSVVCDLVFATSTPLTIAVPGVYAARYHKVPLVFEVRDLWPEMPIAVNALRNPLAIRAARWLEQMAYRNSAHIIALSPGMRDGVIAAGAPPGRVSVIPNSCDSALFQVGPEAGVEFRRTLSWLGNRPLVLYAGTLGRIHNVSYLAEIAAEMATIDSDVRFLVIGSGKEAATVEAVAQRLGVLGVNFFMRDRMRKKDIPAALSAADVATSLTIDLKPLWANSANKFFDALAARTPIMINYQGWQADLVNATSAGIVVPPQDARQAARMLAEFLQSPARLDQAQEAADALARERFDRDRLADELAGTLEGVVHHGGKPWSSADGPRVGGAV